MWEVSRLNGCDDEDKNIGLAKESRERLARVGSVIPPPLPLMDYRLFWTIREIFDIDWKRSVDSV
jgi:hypothetical protein